MKIKRKQVAYIEPELQGDFYEMANIQTSLLGNAITSEQKYLHGFVDFSITQEAILGCVRLHLVKMVTSKRSSRVFAFCAGIPYSIANRIGYLQAIIPDVSEHFEYACFVHICVMPNKVKNGFGSQLLRQLEYTATTQNFGALIAPIPFDNEVAQIFFKTRGFKQLQTPLVTDRVILYKKLSKNTQ